MNSENQKASNSRKERGEIHPEEIKKQRSDFVNQGSPSITGSIADAVVLKDKNLYFLTNPVGNIPAIEDHGYGLYLGDCRFVNTYEMTIADKEPNVLVASAQDGFQAIYELTNPEIELEDGTHIHRDEIGISWRRLLDNEKLLLYDSITVRNYEQKAVSFRLSLTFGSQFESIFAVRGLLPVHPGKLHPPSWNKETLTFAYSGADEVFRRLKILFSPRPDAHDDCSACFDLRLEPGQTKQLTVFLYISESKEPTDAEVTLQTPDEISNINTRMGKNFKDWINKGANIRTNSLLLNRQIKRAYLDLNMLRTEVGEKEYLAAGVPWYVALFGRDSLIAALQTLGFNPSIAADTLRILARYQGKEVNEWKDEEPGKILHELRTGELAALGEIPHTPYFGTIDATPLFLVLIARHAERTGNLSLFNELRNHIDRALLWIDEYADLDGDGFIEYKGHPGIGLKNQGWKDAGDAIINSDGSLATQPIALVEAQAYVYLAKNLLSDLFERSGEAGRAQELRKQAIELRERFNHAFWDEKLGFYVLALQKDNRPAAVVTSNPGHALWAGIADEDKARKTVQRLMQDDMFNGWGIRTLSSKEKRYNPIGYHVGTVWPHDNGLIVEGFRHYGYDQEALKIFNGIAEAAIHFENYGLPELFAGFPRDPYQVPVKYPIACHPQAWAAGSLIHMLESILGLHPSAFENRLAIKKPMLPGFVNELEVNGLRVSKSKIDLRIQRELDGRISAEVLGVDGDLDVDIEQD